MDSFLRSFEDMFEWPRLDQENPAWTVMSYSQDVFLRLSSHEASTCAHQPGVQRCLCCCFWFSPQAKALTPRLKIIRSQGTLRYKGEVRFDRIQHL